MQIKQNIKERDKWLGAASGRFVTPAKFGDASAMFERHPCEVRAPPLRTQGVHPSNKVRPRRRRACYSLRYAASQRGYIVV